MLFQAVQVVLFHSKLIADGTHKIVNVSKKGHFASGFCALVLQ